MTTTDYPALFSASDKASLRAQAAYLRILWAHLFSLVLAGITARIAGAVDPSSYRMLANATAVILAVGLLLMWVLRATRYEKLWFDCRAVAESVKTAAWRYMMQAPPYDRAENEGHADTGFLKDLGNIQEARPGVSAHLAGLVSGATQISDAMRRTRVLPLDERKKIYLRDRLVDQKTWYEDKARTNRSSASVWFWTVAGLQGVALCLAIVQSDAPLLSIDPVPTIMAVAAAFVAWTQAKRHDELTQSYSLAAQELSSLEALAPRVSDPKSFQAFVNQVEGAISREHTLWMARRNI
jgi:hypothetical protein